MMNYKGVIFDFNGTLIWDTAFHNKAFDIFLEKHDIKLTDEEKTVKIHGKMNPDIMRGIFERELSDPEILEMSLEKELIYQQLVDEFIHFPEGVIQLFENLKSHNIPFSIATSSGIENVEYYIRRLDLNKWFDASTIIYNDGTFNGKPEPDIFLKAAQKMKLQPSEIIIFEDSKAGILAAERAGAGKIVIVNSTNDDYSEFPHQIITHFNQFESNLS